MLVITPNKIGKHVKGKEGQKENVKKKRRVRNAMASKSRAKNRKN